MAFKVNSNSTEKYVHKYVMQMVECSKNYFLPINNNHPLSKEAQSLLLTLRKRW